MISVDVSARRRRSIGGATGTLTLALVVLAVAGALISAARPAAAHATTLARMPVEEAARKATTVVVGTVAGVQPELSPIGVRTAVRLRVEQTLRGRASASVTVYVPGGELPDGSRVVVDSMASFTQGEVCCVFVDARGWVLGGYQGKVHLDGPGPDPGGASASKAAVVGRVEAALAAPAPATAATPESRPQDREQSQSSATVGRPSIAAVTPVRASAGTHSRLTVSGTGFGSAPGKVEFPLGLYGVGRIASDAIVSWTDTLIVCEVPTGSLAGFAVSAGSGPLIVTAENGAQSNPFEFEVPFGYAAKKWPLPQVTYLLNTGGVDSARRERLVDAAAVSWTAAKSAFAFADGGPTNAGAAKDGSNVVGWSDTLPDGVVALTLCYIDPAGRTTECDLQLNDRVAWGEGTTSGTTDIESIAVHEFGHWLCLLDQYADADMDKVMYGFDLPGQRRELTLGDIAGIRWIYPAPWGTLRGTVRDSAGAPLEGATVAIETCEPAESGPDGSFAVTGTPAGGYRVACSLPGYTTRVFSATIVATETTETTVTLSPGAPMPVYRFYQRRNGSHFYTASAAERDRVVSKLAGTYTFEGTAYVVNRLDPTNATPLYRFFNKRNGSHFYTASQSERDGVRARLSATYTYEGVAYLVAGAPSLATIPVYRFFNKRAGSHFYTTSPAEKNRVIRDLSAVYAFEGPAFWVAR